MVSKYKYLHKYINCQTQEGMGDNCFYPLSENEIMEAEESLNIKFPSMLRDFWIEVGCGFLGKGYDGSKGDINRIMDPSEIAEAMTPPHPNHVICHPGVVDFFEEGYIKEGDILFFEIGDSADFLMMRTKSENPNAIYRLNGRLVENSFERFIYRLYYESPEFYFHI